MGPPGGPADAWKVYNGTLYLNFMSQIRDKFFTDPESNIAEADARWIGFWGDLHAGPFNTDCLAETWDGYDCTEHPQPVPPTCTNRCDDPAWSSECSGQTCEELVKTYPCETHYCFNCTWSGFCDSQCGVCSA